MAIAQANVVATRYVVEAGKSSGTLTFSGIPTATDTITLNGVVFTYVAAGATGNEINLGANIGETLANTAAILNASVDADVFLAKYTQDGSSVLTITYKDTGVLGDAYTLIEGSTAITASSGTLTGGYGVIGTTPALPLVNLRANNPDFNANIGTTTSQELRSDRNITDLVRTTGSSEGSIGFELSAEEYEPFIESALGGEFSAPLVITASTTIAAVNATNSYTDSANGFSTTDISPGNFIRVAGFANAANNGISKVVSIATDGGAVVVERLTLIDEAAGPAITVKGKSVRNAAVKKSFSVERQFTDITQFMSQIGMLVGGMTLNASSENIIDGSLNFVGRATEVGTTTIGTGATIPASANPIMSAVANVGSVYENNAPLSGVSFKSINLTTNNNTRSLTAIGDLYPIDINMGSFNAEFAIEAYFSDTSLLNKYLNGTATELSYIFTDDNGNSIVIDAPQVKYSAGSLTGVSLNSDVMQSLTGTVLYDPTLAYALQISYLPA